jgi:hypothetical protein
MSTSETRRALPLARAAAFAVLLATQAGAAPSLDGVPETLERLRREGKVAEAVAAVRDAARREAAGETFSGPGRERFRREMATLKPFALAWFHFTESDLRAALNDLLSLAPAEERRVRRESLERLRERAELAEAVFPAADAAEAREVEARLDSELRSMESQALLALADPERRSRLAHAVEQARNAAGSACAATGVEAARRAVRSAEAAGRELEVCGHALRLWRARPGASREGRLRERVGAIVARLAAMERSAEAREREARSVAESLEQARSLAEELRRRRDHVRSLQHRLDQVASDVGFLEERLGGPRTARSDGMPLESAEAALRDVEQAAAAAVSLSAGLRRLSASKAEIARARKGIEGKATRVERHATSASGLEHLCLTGWETARRETERARRCRDGLALRSVRPVPSPASGAALPPAAGPAVPARPTRTPSSPPPNPTRAAAPGGGADRVDDATFGGIRIVSPARPPRVSVGGRLALKATDMGGHALDRVRWNSLDTSVLVVDGGGVVTGLAPGEAEVLARAADGGLATLGIRVVPDRAAPTGPDPGAVAEDAWGLDGLVPTSPSRSPARPSPAPATTTPSAPADSWGLDSGGAWGGDAEEALDQGLSLLDETFPAPASTATPTPRAPAAARPAPTPAPIPAPAGGDATLHGTWSLRSGRTTSFDCRSRTGVCVFSGFSRGDAPVELRPSGPGAWTGSTKVVGRSGSSGMPMHVTSVDDVVYRVVVDGDRCVVRWSTPRANGGRPTDVVLSRVAASAPRPRGNATLLDGGRSGPYHEFAALCRIGWAQALAKWSAGKADGSIASHLRAAGDHVTMATGATFAPLRAWPDSSARRTRLGELADRLLRSPGGRYREQLAFDLGLGWREMADALAVQAAGEVVRRETCDSCYARIGYLLCSGQQLLQVAEAEERQGDHDRAVRIGQEGRGQLVAAGGELEGLRTVRLASGSCLDLSPVRGPLSEAASARSPAAAVTAADRAFETAHARLAGPGPP